MNSYNINQLEEETLYIFIHNNNINISNEEKKQYIIELTHFFDIIHNNTQNNRNKFIMEFDNLYFKIINNNIYNCIKNNINIIYNYIFSYNK